MAWPIDHDLGFFRTSLHDAFGADTGGRVRPHSGLDFTPYKQGAAIPVYAVEAGHVFYVGGRATDTTGPGINVRIGQASGDWLYGHLSRADVRPGQRVSEGQQVGLTGASGGTTGVHLHVTRFTSRAAALANAAPSHRLGRTVATWAAANALADPMEIIGRAAPGGAAPLPKPEVIDIPITKEMTMAMIGRLTNYHPDAFQYVWMTESGIDPILDREKLDALREVKTKIHEAQQAGHHTIALTVYQARTYRDHTNRAAGRGPYIPDIPAK